MNDERAPHTDLGAYLTGRLSPEEAASFERHLAECASCRREAGELGTVNVLLEDMSPPWDVPTGLAERALGAVRDAAGGEPEPARPAPRQRFAFARPALAALGVIALLAAAVFAGTQIENGDEVRAGVLEVSGVMRGQDGEREGEVEVRMLGIGREIQFHSADLPILPTGEYYEIWFVAPDDTAQSPNRISAGTFHPDENGRSDVTVTAAVDPAKYPAIEITAEPGDGDPAATGRPVLGLDARNQLPAPSP